MNIKLTFLFQSDTKVRDIKDNNILLNAFMDLLNVYRVCYRINARYFSRKFSTLNLN